MLGYLILLFTLVPIAELTLLIKVGQRIGIGYTLGIVIFTGILGASLARFQGLVTIRRIQNEINLGKVPADHLFDGFLILCSGILLMTPGFITDIAGFAGLIPATRNILKHLLIRKIKHMIREGKIVRITPFNS